jgi:hypothetical protein
MDTDLCGFANFLNEVIRGLGIPDNLTESFGRFGNQNSGDWDGTMEMSQEAQICQGISSI